MTAAPKPTPAVAGHGDLQAAVRTLQAQVAELMADKLARDKGREKKRRQREHRESGRRQFTVWANEDELAEKLVRGGFLDSLSSDQPDRISEALQAAIDGLALDPVPLRHAR